jgi:secretion/DNA translocation related TadE-like protein
VTDRDAVRLDDDAGSASIWVLTCCALLVVVATFATLRAMAVLARHRAEASADLAAVAAAGRIGVDTGSCAAAARIAERNGGRLSACRLDLPPDGRSGTVQVTVIVAVRLPVLGTEQVRASARAGRAVAGVGSEPTEPAA